MGNDTMAVLDQVLAGRHSSRIFAEAAPTGAAIHALLEAGWLAPHAGAAGIPLAEKRRFFVVSRDSPSHGLLYSFLMDRLRSNRRKLGLARRIVPGLGRKTAGFYSIVSGLSKKGIKTLESAPFWIIVAERRGFPPAEDKTLAHVLQNMWLKATELGLAFMLLSATSMASRDRRIMETLGLRAGEWALDGCLVGMHTGASHERKDRLPESAVRWME